MDVRSYLRDGVSVRSLEGQVIDFMWKLFSAVGWALLATWVGIGLLKAWRDDARKR